MTLIAIEACIYLALCGAFCSVKSVRAYLKSLPSPHRWLLAIFFGLLLAGHLINKPRLTFPMSSWALYGRPEHPDTLVFYRYQGIDDEGRAVELDPFRLLSPIPRAELASKIKGLCRMGFSDDQTARREEAQQQVTALLRAVGAVHNHRHPEQPVGMVELIRCFLDMTRPGSRTEIRSELLLRAKLNSKGGR